jgi:hypothetical protein
MFISDPYLDFFTHHGSSGQKGTESRIRIRNTVYPDSRVSDPHGFNADPDTDPDPAFFLIADPDSGSRIRIPDPDPGFDDLKLEKITVEKKKLIFFGIKNYNLPIPRPP